MTPTQQKPDTSRERLADIASTLEQRARMYRDAPYHYDNGDAALDEGVAATLRALASPPPVEGLGLETTAKTREQVCAGRGSRQDGEAVLRDICRLEEDAKITRDFLAIGDARANSLAAEVERLSSDHGIATLVRRLNEAEAELSRLKAPLADGEVEAAIAICLREGNPRTSIWNRKEFDVFLRDTIVPLLRRPPREQGEGRGAEAPGGRLDG